MGITPLATGGNPVTTPVNDTQLRHPATDTQRQSSSHRSRHRLNLKRYPEAWATSLNRWPETAVPGKWPVACSFSFHWAATGGPVSPVSRKAVSRPRSCAHAPRTPPGKPSGDHPRGHPACQRDPGSISEEVLAPWLGRWPKTRGDLAMRLEAARRDLLERTEHQVVALRTDLRRKSA